MPSHALIRWQTDRMARLARIEAQNVAVGAALPADPALIDENLRAFVLLLSAHFQGFCRDLHSECIQAVSNAVPAPMVLMFQTLCEQGRELARANAKYSSIKADFQRFDFDLTSALTADPALPVATLAANPGVHHARRSPERLAQLRRAPQCLSAICGRAAHLAHRIDLEKLVRRAGDGTRSGDV